MHLARRFKLDVTRPKGAYLTLSIRCYALPLCASQPVPICYMLHLLRGRVAPGDGCSKVHGVTFIAWARARPEGARGRGPTQGNPPPTTPYLIYFTPHIKTARIFEIDFQQPNSIVDNLTHQDYGIQAFGYMLFSRARFLP